ncbi:hypothetical protein [Streptomyces sp. NBC_01089]|uniref:hypothetical protein n=1 Tax=Streptomyces sp. NBC_01089 TaxID=2903747 RepID=UPI00386C7433|nr:hypothetical protein OG510_00335 [Streptomyces sp. NBC_01089]WSU46371.1 hypothetical protein OG510_36815 [Streptomyces sp. NBC_01089]
MNENLNGNPVRTARIVGAIVALVLTVPALIVAVGNELPEDGAAATTTVLATNAGPATPPSAP